VGNNFHETGSQPSSRAAQALLAGLIAWMLLAASASAQTTAAPSPAPSPGAAPAPASGIRPPTTVPATAPTVPVPPTIQVHVPPPETGKVRDVAHVGGTNANPLVGYGLVVGLAGSGDTQGSVSQQMMQRVLQSLGMNLPVRNTIDPIALTMKNTAMVLLTANLPAYARPGDSVDVMVSSLGDAKSLEGGILVMSLLKAANGQVYSSAQGPVQVANAQYSGIGLGPAQPKPHKTAGIIVKGGLITRQGVASLDHASTITWVLNHPDFEMAARVATALNAYVPGLVAVARDSATVEVNLAAYPGQGPTAEIVARMGAVPLDHPPGGGGNFFGPILFDGQSGNLVRGGDVRLRSGSIDAGGTRIEITDQRRATVKDLVQSLQQLGLPPQQRVEILRTLQRCEIIPGELTIQ